MAVCTSTWKIVDVLSGDESTYAVCQSASVRPQPDRTYYSTSNRVAVYFIGQMTSPGVVPSTTAASSAHDHQQQQQREHRDAIENAPLQLLHYTGQSAGLLLLLLTLSPPIPLRLYTLPYRSNPPFLIFDIRALWRSGLSARAPECQKLKMVA